MSNQINYFKRLKKNPISVILDRAPLSVKYLTAKSFLSSDKQLVDDLYAKILEDNSRKKIIQSQLEDGRWKTEKTFSIAERQNAMQFLLQLKNLTHLINFGDTIKNENLKNGLISLIKYQKSDGKFPLLQHHHGYALWILGQYGLSGNPFVEKSFRWIIKKQRKDGGWISPTMIADGESIDKIKSCVWTTLFITLSLSTHSRLKNSDACIKAVKFILENYLSIDTPALFPEPNSWDHLANNTTDNGMFRGGTLLFLEALASIKYAHEHKNFKKALDWLFSIQFSDGLFPAIVHISKKGDHMVTYRVLKLLRQLESE